MKSRVSLAALLVMFLGLPTPVFAQGTLVFSVVEDSPPSKTVPAVLHQAYLQLGIQLEFQELPGERGLSHANAGYTDGETFRIEGVDKEYSNLVRIEVAVRKDQMHLFIRQGSEFAVKGWESIPQQYTICHVLGIKFIEYAAREYQLQTETVETAEQLFYLLKKGRCDVIVAGAREGEHFASQAEFEGLIRLDPPIQTTSLYHYLHKRHADLIPKITAVLQEMEARGIIQEIREQIEATSAP